MGAGVVRDSGQKMMWEEDSWDELLAERIYQRYRCAKVDDSTFATVLVDDFKRLAKRGVVNGNTRRLEAIARAERCPGQETPPGSAG